MTTNVVAFVLASFMEIAGCVAYWLWLRRGASFAVALLGTARLRRFDSVPGQVS